MIYPQVSVYLNIYYTFGYDLRFEHNQDGRKMDLPSKAWPTERPPDKIAKTKVRMIIYFLVSAQVKASHYQWTMVQGHYAPTLFSH